MTLRSIKQQANFTCLELQKLFNLSTPKDSLFSISTDSREIGDHQIFLPLVGEKFDGHDFINDVFRKGVRFSFCEKKKISKIEEQFRKNLILVDSTLNSYHLVANYNREKVNPKVVAVTGSSGKTTVKDLISCVLSKKYKIHKTEANFNNEVGVPKTLLEMPGNTQVLVLELAMRARGEIGYLAKTALPDIGVITNIGSAHVGRLGSKDTILEAKCELLRYLRNKGLAVLFNDPRLVNYSGGVWKGETLFYDLSSAFNISFREGRSLFSMGDEQYSIGAHGKVHILNSLCAVIIAKYLGVSTVEIKEGLNTFKVPSGRGNVICLKDNIYLIDESYNANPDSIRVAVSNLVDFWGEVKKKILVLGEVAELGEYEKELLDDLNEWLKHRPITNIITVGEKLKEINTKALRVRDINECFDLLKTLIEPKTVILIKGSNVASLGNLVELLKKNYG